MSLSPSHQQLCDDVERRESQGADDGKMLVTGRQFPLAEIHQPVKCHRCGVEPEIERRKSSSTGTEQSTCGGCGMASPMASELTPKSWSRFDCHQAVVIEWNRMQSALAPPRRFLSLRGEVAQ